MLVTVAKIHFCQLTIGTVCRFPIPFPPLCYNHFVFILATFGYVDFNTRDSLTTLTEVFDSGYALSKDNTFLGHRPVISKNPLTHARHYVWQTYAQADERRRHIGSAIHHLFESRTVGGGEHPTVGIWSPNTPGEFLIPGPPQSAAQCQLSTRMRARRIGVKCVWKGRSHPL